ncbi:DUF5682 family protein [Rariglobus hedericola]|uniref:Uncharacterized protein n=1 Tax=Rariglobus hedericola TaxID=2597822 RepID=A0A556QR09_9BACT|nr:DUF5682 family protein [Rariglobus hedericola]TSJ79078.1 hypothetical protein FPL22_07225 [Rariglobus hedericola]
MTTVFGIRHHGPGCARSLVKSLDALRPDLVLIEGPPDADELMGAVADASLKPPVAILVYDAESPRRAAFYPFAEFSPEWQAMKWAAANAVTMRFLDLPCAHHYGIDAAKEQARAEAAAAANAENTKEAESEVRETEEPGSARHDPLQWLAKADGYSDGERWWNDRVEEREHDGDLFAAVAEALTALRTELALPESERDLRREAWMRRGIREAEKSGAQNIAVVCGAWHVPALRRTVRASDDAALLKGLPKTKVRATWAPWTYERLATASGYGAGIESPGWYEHLWQGGSDTTVRWMTKAARVLREADMSASSANSIEAVRLAEALAGLRGRPKPGLPETLEAMRAVFCEGDPMALSLLRRPLLIGERLGELPEGLAQLPLQEDIERQQKTLRLKPTASVTPLELDLREPGGRARSVFLHRLLAVKINWGRKADTRGGKGTFKEQWSLKWEADMVLAVVDASSFGNTLVAAAEARLVRAAAADPTLENLVTLLEHALLAELPGAGEVILGRVQAAAAMVDDPPGLLRAIAPLARLARYGSVRQTDLNQVRAIVTGLATRAHVELPASVSGLADEAAEALAKLIGGHDEAIRLLEDAALAEEWRAVTRRIMEHGSAHPLLRGLCTRMQRDADALEGDEAATRLSHALSAAQTPDAAAAWLDGFLSGGGAVLVHDPELLGLLHAWLSRVPADYFQAVLPLLRRTFSRFTGPERGQIGQSVAQLGAGGVGGRVAADAGTLVLDETRARPAVDMTARLLGLSTVSRNAS